jgi:PST family polysaccharide transporter
MSALAALVFPSVFIYIRSYLTTNVGLNMAAYWEGYSKLSLFISGLAISSISLYYLPRLTRASSALEIRQVVFWGLKFMILFGFPSLMLLFIFGNTLIPLLYNDDFLHTFFLLKWELLGTFFKLLSFAVSFLMVAKKMTKVFVFSELMSGLIFLILSLVFIRYTGVEGASIAYATTYLLYFVWTLIYFNGKFKFFSKN